MSYESLVSLCPRIHREGTTYPSRAERHPKGGGKHCDTWDKLEPEQQSPICVPLEEIEGETKPLSETVCSIDIEARLWRSVKLEVPGDKSTYA